MGMGSTNELGRIKNVLIGMRAEISYIASCRIIVVIRVGRTERLHSNSPHCSVETMNWGVLPISRPYPASGATRSSR
jgi:hypothetical protein